MHTRAAPLNKSNPIEGGPQQFSRIYRTIYQTGVSRIFTTCGAMSSIVTSRMRNRVFLSFPAHAPPQSPGANTALGGTDARRQTCAPEVSSRGAGIDGVVFVVGLADQLATRREVVPRSRDLEPPGCHGPIGGIQVVPGGAILEPPGRHGTTGEIQVVPG